MGAFFFAIGCTRQAQQSRAPLFLYAEAPASAQQALPESLPTAAPATKEAPAGEPAAAPELDGSSESTNGAAPSSSQGAISSPAGAEPVVPPHLLGRAGTDRPPASRPLETAPGQPFPRRVFPPSSANLGRSIPSGDACRTRLTELGIAYDSVDETRGIETPVVLKGPIGGIRYTLMGTPIVCDCRLLVALSSVAPKLRALGVSEVRLAGAYSYRMARVGRLSLHAFGLAFDVHELVVHGVVLSVARDFARGLRDGCAESSPALNRVACTLESTGVFRELLTPDYDADHKDHLHLAIAPLGQPGLIAKRTPARAEPLAARKQAEPPTKHASTDSKAERAEPSSKPTTPEPTAKRAPEPTAKRDPELTPKRKRSEIVAKPTPQPVEEPAADEPSAKPTASKRIPKRAATKKPAEKRPASKDSEKRTAATSDASAPADEPPVKRASRKPKSDKDRPTQAKLAEQRPDEPVQKLANKPRKRAKPPSTSGREKSAVIFIPAP